MRVRGPVAAVVFDMDGLLLDTERLAHGAYELARAELGLSPDADLFFEMLGLDEAASDKILQQRLPPPVPVAEFKIVWEQLHAQMILDDVPLKPGVSEVLERLANNGFPMAVATSTKRSSAENLLRRAAVHQYFSAILCGDDVAKGKPFPDIYILAAQALRHVPGDCVAFEDSSNGVRAAVAAGCLTVQVPDIVAPPPDIVALGHIIAPDLLHGARSVGLFE